jgi:polyferredoxin
MNALVGSLLAVLVLGSFVRPRWWLSVGPVAVAIALTGYRLAASRGASTEEAVALVGIVLLAAAMEAALLVGALARAGSDRVRGRLAGAAAAARAARGVALVGFAFLGTTWVVGRASSGVLALLGVAAVVIVLTRAWRARRQRRRPSTRRSTQARPRASATARQTISPLERRRARMRRGAARPSPRRRVSS